jgi:hypothetical protein
MVRLQTLDLRIGVRVPASQPTQADILRKSFELKTMRTLALSSLLLISGILGLAQDPKEMFDKAPPAIDEALRARVDQYYHAFMQGKFKEAYLLVSEESQDAFLEADKDRYKACETIKIRYSDDFTKAVVIESCKTDWKWHGVITPTTFPITSSWKIVDGKWFWYYVRPTQAPFPFSPTGFITVPPADAADKDSASVVPKDLKAAAQGILAQVSLDKMAVHLRPDEASHDVVHIHNGMPGVIKLQLDQLVVPGLTITLGKTELTANQETTVSFDYRLDNPGIACVDCAKKLKGTSTVTLRVIPTGQTFTLAVTFATPQVPGAKQ